MNRVSVRALTIDSSSTKDIDDAIWVSEYAPLALDWSIDHSSARTLYRVDVSITDVASRVLRDSLEDKQAHRMVATRYHSHGNDPMLPRPLSEQELSLWPHLPSRGVTIRLDLDESFETVERQVFLSEFASLGRLTYGDVPKILADSSNRFHTPLTLAARVAEGLSERRRNLGALVAYAPQSGWVSTEEGHLRQLRNTNEALGHILIQELMILANSEFAAWAAEKDIPILFRNHQPSVVAPPRAELLQEFLAATSLETGNPGFLEKRMQVLLSRARYERILRGHYGLNLGAYCHLTSPIRRYADLISQRQVFAHLTGQPLPYSVEELNAIGLHINRTLEQRADTTAEFLKTRANVQAAAQLETGDLTKLSGTKFERVVKVAARTGEDVPEALRGEFVSRLQRKNLPLICATVVFVEAPRLAGWNDLRREIIVRYSESPEQAVSLFAQATGVAQWPSPTFSGTESGPDHQRIFSYVASLVLPEGSYVSEPATAPSAKQARQRSALGLLAALAGVVAPPPETPRPEVRTDRGLNPVAALHEYAQNAQLPDPAYTFTGAGPAHSPTFECRCEFDSRIGAGYGRTKQAAKADAAKSLLEQLKRTALPTSTTAPNPVESGM